MLLRIHPLWPARVVEVVLGGVSAHAATTGVVVEAEPLLAVPLLPLAAVASVAV